MCGAGAGMDDCVMLGQRCTHVGLNRRSQDGMRWCSKKDKQIMVKK